MRFFFGLIAMLLWMIFIVRFGIKMDNNISVLCLAIVAAGAMAGGDGK